MGRKRASTFRGFQICASHESSRASGESIAGIDRTTPATRGVDLRHSLRPARGLNDFAGHTESTPLRSAAPVGRLARRKWAERRGTLARIRADVYNARTRSKHYVSLPASAALARDRRVTVSWSPLRLPRERRSVRLPAWSNAARRCGPCSSPWSPPGRFVSVEFPSFQRRRDTRIPATDSSDRADSIGRRGSIRRREDP